MSQFRDLTIGIEKPSRSAIRFIAAIQPDAPKRPFWPKGGQPELLTKFFVADEGHDFLTRSRIFLRIANVTQMFLREPRKWRVPLFMVATAMAIVAARLIPLPPAPCPVIQPFQDSRIDEIVDVGLQVRCIRFP